MIVTPRFVFLHLHKSGGTFINECLLRFVPDARLIQYHWPRRLLPAEWSGVRALGLVRNPWSYYVSWYTFQSAAAEPNTLFRVLSRSGRLDFDATIRNLLALGTDSAGLDELVSALPAGYTNRGLNLPGFALSPIRGTGLGFYSYLYGYMYEGHAGTLRVGRMESLRVEFPAMLRAAGQTVSPEMEDYFREAAPRNASAHDDYRQYYNESLRDLVSRCDASVIERHGYRFDGGSVAS